MPEPVLRRLDWSFPAPPVEREMLEVLPDDPASTRPPLLFVHGAAHGAWCWREHWMPAAAAAGWPCYALSLRGHGASGGHDDLARTPLRFYEHDVLQAITTLPQPPVLVGHSMGAVVVGHVLERYPARAGVLVAPVPVGHGFDLLVNLARHDPLVTARALVGGRLPLDRDNLFSPALDDATAQVHVDRLGDESTLAAYQLVLPRRLRASKAPVLVVGSGADRIVPPSRVARTARHYGTRAHLFAGIGHDMMLDAGWRPPLDLILGWLDDLLATT